MTRNAQNLEEATMHGNGDTEAKQLAALSLEDNEHEKIPHEDRLIVGVDFGTTFSGVAAAYSATPDDVDIVKSWPGGNGMHNERCGEGLSQILIAQRCCKALC